MRAEAWKRYVYLRERTESLILRKLRQIGYLEIVKKIEMCGKYVNILKCVGCGTRHYAGYIRCKNRLCLNCSHVKSVLYAVKLIKRIEREGLECSHLVLTLKNYGRGKLRRMINDIKGYFRKLFNTEKSTRGRFKGYVSSIEIKEGKGGGWHVHFHVLLAHKGKYERDYEYFREKWKKITKWKGSVFIRKCEGFKGAIEVVKYIAKIDYEMSIESFKELVNCIRGLRQINTGGVFRGLSKEVEELEREYEEEGKEKSLRDFVCQKCGCTQAELETVEYEIVKDIVLYDVEIVNMLNKLKD